MSKEFTVLWYDGHTGIYNGYYVMADSSAVAYKNFVTALKRDMKNNGYIVEVCYRDIFVKRPGSEILPQIKREWLQLTNITIINESEKVYHTPMFDKDSSFMGCTQGEKYNDNKYMVNLIKKIRKEARK